MTQRDELKHLLRDLIARHYPLGATAAIEPDAVQASLTPHEKALLAQLDVMSPDAITQLIDEVCVLAAQAAYPLPVPPQDADLDGLPVYWGLPDRPLSG